MPISHERFEYHLTPDGWIAGSEHLDFGSKERPIPPDRVLTVDRIETMSSSFSKVEVEFKETYRSETSAVVEELIIKFGEHP